MHETIDRDGAVLAPHPACSAEVQALMALSQSLPTDQAGVRLQGNTYVRELTRPGSSMQEVAAACLGSQARPVRAVFFDKSAANNWPLGWHQDRTICVKERHEVSGFLPYSVKTGILHVQPPASLLSRMVTLRLHLDPCGADNAPLKVAFGTHRLGLVPVADVEDAVAASVQAVCLADIGSIWAYRTLILHASDAANKPSRRRVLQVDFAAEDLPQPLEWAGI